MQANAAHALALILESEGGFVDDPRDPGGATNMGVTLRTLSAWRKKECTVDDVRALGEVEAQTIFRAQYLAPIQFDKLPEGVDYAVADAAVNSGPARAAELLQGVLGVEADGIIGLHTLAALDGREAVEVIHAYSRARLSFLRGLESWQDFGRGWATRVARVEHDAVEMATGIEHALKPDLVPGASAKAPPAPAPSGWAALIAAVVALFKRS